MQPNPGDGGGSQQFCAGRQHSAVPGAMDRDLERARMALDAGIERNRVAMEAEKTACTAWRKASQESDRATDALIELWKRVESIKAAK